MRATAEGERRREDLWPPFATGEEQERGNDHAFLREMTHRRPTRIAGLIQRGSMDTGPYLGIDRRRAAPAARSAAAVPPDERDGGRRRRALLVHRRDEDAQGRATRSPPIETRWPIKRVIYLMLENRSFNNLFGKFPGVRGTTVGVRERRREAADPVPGVAARRPPARPRRVPALRERRRDGRVRHRDLRLDVRLHDLRRGPDPQLLAVGTRVLPVGELLRVGRGTQLPEPLLLHRGLAPAGSPTTRRTSGAARRTARASRAGAATRSATTSSSS